MNNGKTPIKKQPRIKDKKTLNSARGKACIKCANMTETTVSAHYTGIMQQYLGKGLGGKLPDVLTAWLCYECHNYFDQYKGVITPADRLERSEEFADCVIETLDKKFELGIHTGPWVKNTETDFYEKIEFMKQVVVKFDQGIYK